MQALDVKFYEGQIFQAPDRWEPYYLCLVGRYKIEAERLAAACLIDMVAEELRALSGKVDGVMVMDENKVKILYVPNAASRRDFRDSDAQILIIRPHFHKDEVVKRTLEKKIFANPPKDSN